MLLPDKRRIEAGTLILLVPEKSRRMVANAAIAERCLPSSLRRALPDFLPTILTGRYGILGSGMDGLRYGLNAESLSLPSWQLEM